MAGLMSKRYCRMIMTNGWILEIRGKFVTLPPVTPGRALTD